MKCNQMALLSVLAFMLAGFPSQAADLYPHDGWAALTTDRKARHVGDALTILIYESATASDTASNGLQRDSNFGGQLSASASFSKSADLSFNSGTNATGSTGRSGGMVAEISAVVDKILPNGDLHVSGAQTLNINGEHTNIRVQGRVRLADIGADNTVLSNRLANASIDYNGSGFVSRSAAPGLLVRIFNWLGIL